MTPPAELSIADNPEERRYEARMGSEVIGFIPYEEGPGQLTVLYTEVDPDYEGKGIGSALVVGALDDIRRRGLTVVPVCPFVRGYIGRHPEYSDLVAEPERA